MRIDKLGSLVVPLPRRPHPITVGRSQWLGLRRAIKALERKPARGDQIEAGAAASQGQR